MLSGCAEYSRKSSGMEALKIALGGDGNGNGNGDGNGYGDGCGDGNGYGDGYGNGNGWKDNPLAFTIPFRDIIIGGILAIARGKSIFSAWEYIEQFPPPFKRYLAKFLQSQENQFDFDE